MRDVTRWILSVVLLLSVGGGLAFFLAKDFGSEQDQVHTHLERLIERLQKAADEPNLQTLLRARQMKNFFTPRCQVMANAYGLSGEIEAKDLGNRLSRGRVYYQRLQLWLEAVVIQIDDEQQANVHLRLIWRGERENGERTEKEEIVVCRLKKVEGHWLIQAVTLTPGLER